MITAVRTRAEAFYADTLTRLKALTPVRVVGDVIVMVAVILLDLWPGPWAEQKASGWTVVAFIAVYLVLLPLRHLLPATVMIGGAAIPFLGPALMVVLSYTAGRRIESWVKAVVSTAITFVVVVLLWDWDARPIDIEPVYGMLILVTIFGVGVALPFLVGRYLAQREALVQAMQDREARMHVEHRMLSRQVRLRERSRIAQDMHDSLGHRLSLISVHAGALALDPSLGEKQREAIGVLRSAALTGMEELRAIIGVLRAEDGPDDDPATRTVESIDSLVGDARKAGVLVSLVRGGQAHPLPSRVSHAAYRVAQEGLTNASKHAPGAAVQVTVKYEPDALVVEVRNNPSRNGSPGGVPGVGLIGLSERVRLAGGILHVGGLPSGGFRIAAVLPYEETALPDEPEDEQDETESPRGIRKWAGIGSIAGASIVLTVIIGGFTYLGAQPVTEVVTQQNLDRIQEGQPEAEVMALLPAGDEPLVGDGERKSQASPELPGARCVYHITDEQSYLAKGTRVVRFCFRDGKLIEKKIHVQRNNS
ncbi:two-component sensor histidine kinase [Lentzea sp. PSKA42]|uniref:histidine kinase n=1 Tax=Lentzea indica TaxID=2604800 RepID=A0ABX1FHK4_9PSEU|nr:histidine kinase [Lentzea indica]NKE58448.1 two-component sensor histidine kinase [Lentzea indica]